MSFWTSVLPMAGMVAGNMVAPGLGGAIGGAVGGALAGNARKQEQLQKQRQTANASADAIAASWARRDGKGSIPETQWASGDDDVLAGAVGGGMQGYAMKDMFSGFGGPTQTGMQKMGAANAKAFDSGNYGAMKGVNSTQNFYTPSGGSNRLDFSKLVG